MRVADSGQRSRTGDRIPMKDDEVVVGNPNYQAPFGNTLLHGAVISGDIQELERLLSAGASPDVANRDGRTPADVAMILGHRGISDLLISHSPQRLSRR